MAASLTITSVQFRRDTRANFVTKNSVYLIGEPLFETDTYRLKIGNGVDAYTDLPYANSTVHEEVGAPTATDTQYDVGSVWIDTSAIPHKDHILVSNDGSAAVWRQNVHAEDLSALGAGDMLKSVYDTNDDGKIDSAATADRLTSAFSIALTGAVTGSATTDGSSAANIEVTLADSGVTAGTYTKVTVDEKGIITDGQESIALADISDAGTAAAADIGTAAGNVPVLGSDGKLASSVLPPETTHEVYSADTTDDMIAGTFTNDPPIDSDPDLGDECILVTGEIYRLVKLPYTVIDNWYLASVPNDGVLSVNGQTGPSVVLTTSDISEGTNMYYTDARATAAAEAAIAAATIVIDGGAA